MVSFIKRESLERFFGGYIIAVIDDKRCVG